MRRASSQGRQRRTAMFTPPPNPPPPRGEGGYARDVDPLREKCSFWLPLSRWGRGLGGGVNALPRTAFLLLTLLLPTPTLAAEPTREQADFFEKTVRPILTDNCFSCHSQKASKKKGGLVLDSLDGLLTGGDSGPALVIGQPEKSLLIKAVRQTDDDLKMPPKGTLTGEQISALSS